MLLFLFISRVKYAIRVLFTTITHKNAQQSVETSRIPARGFRDEWYRGEREPDMSLVNTRMIGIQYHCNGYQSHQFPPTE